MSSHSVMARIRGIRNTLIVCGVAFGVCQCDDEKQGGPFLSLRLLDSQNQPQESNLGVLLAVSARGSDSMRFDVAGGTLDFYGANPLTPVCVNPNGIGGGPAAEQRFSMFSRLGTTGPVSFVVAVHPTAQQEAWVSAELGNISSSDSGVPHSDSQLADAGNTTMNDCGTIHFAPIGVYASEVVSLGRAPSAGTGGGGSGQGGATATGTAGGTGETAGASGVGGLGVGGQSGDSQDSGIDGGAR